MYKGIIQLVLKYISPNPGVASQQSSSSSTHTQKDRHGQSSELVQLCERYELSNDNIDKEVSDEHILEIYPQLEKWRLVAIHLDLIQRDVWQSIESRAKGNEELMRLYMLQEWKRMNNGAATYQVLLEVLTRCKCSKSAIQVCELLS